MKRFIFTSMLACASGLLLLPALMLAQYGISKPPALTDSAGKYTTAPSGKPFADWLISSVVPGPLDTSINRATGTHTGLLWYRDWLTFNGKPDTIAGPFVGDDMTQIGGLLRTSDYNTFMGALYPTDSLAMLASETTTGFLRYSDFYSFSKKLDTLTGPQANQNTSGYLYYGDWDYFNQKPDTTIGQFANLTHSGFLKYYDWDYFSTKPDTTIGPFADATHSGFLYYYDWLYFSTKPDTTIGPFVDATHSGLLYYYDWLSFTNKPDTVIGPFASPSPTMTSPVVTALAICGDPNLFAGTWGGGAYLSINNGASPWIAAGLTNNYIYAFAVSGTKLFAATDGAGVFLSSNNGTSWTAVNTGLTDIYVPALIFSGTNLFAATLNHGVFLSTDYGTSWTEVSTGLPMDVNFLALAVSGTDLFAGSSGNGVFLSTDNGTSWTAVNTGLTYLYVYALAVSGTNLFAGTYGGGVFLSTDNGSSWAPVNTGLTNTDVQVLAVSGTDLFAGTDGGVFLSTDNGTSWAPVNTGLTNTNIRAFAVSEFNHVFAGTLGGAFLSLDNGAHWSPTDNTGTSGFLKQYDWVKFNNKSDTDTLRGPFASLTNSGLISYLDFAYWNTKPDTVIGSFASAITSGFLYYYDWLYFSTKPDTVIGPIASDVQAGFLSYADHATLTDLTARRDSLAYGGLWISPDNADTVFMGDATDTTRILHWQPDNYLKNIVAQDSELVIGAGGLYEASYNMHVVGTGTVIVTFCVNDAIDGRFTVKLPTTTETIASSAPQMVDLSAYDEVKLQVEITNSAGVTFIFDRAQLHLTRLDNKPGGM